MEEELFTVYITTKLSFLSPLLSYLVTRLDKMKGNSLDYHY